jgi:Predicted ATPase
LPTRLRLLTSGRRPGDRHRSLRSTLDWSYALLDEPDRAVLRRVSVFAGPFTSRRGGGCARRLATSQRHAVPTILAGLAEQSLLVPIPNPAGTRYRALETIRQYGVDRLRDAEESEEAQSRHLSWCLQAGAALQLPRSTEDVSDWRSTFDQIADELRDALNWAADNAQYRAEAHRLAITVG